MTIEQLNKLALKHYEQGGDRIIECWGKEDKQEFLDEHGDNAEKEALKLFEMLHDYVEDIRNA